MAREGRLAPVASLAVAWVTASCVFRSAGDVVAQFGVRNESHRELIVRISSTYSVVPPGASGLALSLIGGTTGPIQVLDLGCRRLQELELTTQKGWVVISADGSARLEGAEAVSGDRLETTDACSS